ncbi:unnamed protein product (macronuclear) [Paramecium tetraurelia]|uniref:Uncharacterized protein n=1 Tax=Paramecium tetraurelia TaxID=5888 RepID=A0DY65_PARTE|nr:uncharacterized protein GSPATT00002950001 [Paramecium tetraurelia]CAK87982.1 unnamed protein product [Paramecium tetraurelia]|eukprot:XP_001455379.1 hypothetical protein (macronuclear) [Paramecium tetraurelia strain d4-2]
MNSVLKGEQPFFDQQRRSTISPENGKQIQNILHRKINYSQTDLITPIAIKQSHKKQAISQGLQQLLKSSPYSKLVSQKSQQQLQYQDSFSQLHLNGYTPNQQQSQLLFKPEVRTPSLNSTNSSSIKPRMRNQARDSLQKKSFDSQNAISYRDKDKQTISQLQTIIQKTSVVLQSYKEELQKNIQEKQDLLRQIQTLEQNKTKK